MNPHNCAHLIFDKVAKNIRWTVDSLFKNFAEKSGYLPAKKLKLDPCQSPCSSLNSKWIKDLYIRPKTLKLVQKDQGILRKLQVQARTFSIELQQPSN
jgi:hypothetical protein